MAKYREWTQRIFALALLLTLAACSTFAPIPKTDTLDASASVAGFERVLQRFVNDQGEVDFADVSFIRNRQVPGPWIVRVPHVGE